MVTILFPILIGFRKRYSFSGQERRRAYTHFIYKNFTNTHVFDRTISYFNFTIKSWVSIRPSEMLGRTIIEIS